MSIIKIQTQTAKQLDSQISMARLLSNSVKAQQPAIIISMPTDLEEQESIPQIEMISWLISHYLK